MIDDLKFAMKCGGSAKKIQLSTTAAVSVKPLDRPRNMDSDSLLDNKLSKSTGNLEQQECKKCQEILNNQLLDKIASHNSMVCKNDSRSNLSIHNPGLLIVEREAALEAQTAFLNSQVFSHIHLSHQKNLNPKPQKHKSRKAKALLRVDSNDDSSDYIQMSMLNQNPHIEQNRSKNSRLKQTISKSRDQYDIPIIRMDNHRQQSSSQNRNNYSKNLKSPNTYLNSSNF